jgi:hypothetical protein
LLPQDACEHAAFGRAIEAGDAAARVCAATGLGSAGHEDAVAGGKAEQLALRRSSATPGTTPHRFGRYASSSAGPSSTSIGIPSVGSSSTAR